MEALVAAAKIPRRYEDCSFDTYYPLNASQKDAVRIARELVEEYPTSDVGLLVLGPCGVGKTHLAVAILRALLERNVRAVFYDFRDLLQEIRGSYRQGSQMTELSVLAPACEADVLVLDDLGASKPTEWAKDTMTYIINRRDSDRKLTIFTTNYVDAPAGSDDEPLVDRVGYRLRSRLHRMCRDVHVTGDDFRFTVRQASFRLPEHANR